MEKIFEGVGFIGENFVVEVVLVVFKKTLEIQVHKLVKTVPFLYYTGMVFLQIPILLVIEKIFHEAIREKILILMKAKVIMKLQATIRCLII